MLLVFEYVFTDVYCTCNETAACGQTNNNIIYLYRVSQSLYAVSLFLSLSLCVCVCVCVCGSLSPQPHNPPLLDRQHHCSFHLPTCIMYKTLQRTVELTIG